ncbi:hypothetical protein GCM10018966_009010 [Streptomyces yanii]
MLLAYLLVGIRRESRFLSAGVTAMSVVRRTARPAVSVPLSLSLWGDSGDADEWWDILVRPRAVLDATGAATLCREPPGSKTETPVRIDGRGISSPILNSSVCALRAICGELQ